MSDNIIIIGGGYSILDGLQQLDLQNILKDKIVVSCNSAFIEFKTTVTCCLDSLFLNQYRNELNQQEIVITKETSQPERFLEKYYLSDSYSSNLGLTGIFALSLFNDLFQNANIFLLGFDFLKGNFHDRNNSNRDIYNIPDKEIYDIFSNIQIKNNIYNINLNSRIENYVKLSWNNFYSFVNYKNGQDNISYIKSILENNNINLIKTTNPHT